MFFFIKIQGLRRVLKYNTYKLKITNNSKKYNKNAFFLSDFIFDQNKIKF